MKILFKYIGKIEECILLVTFPAMTIITLAGTTVRYLHLGSLTWSEEAARYLMIVTAFAGISMGFRENSHLGLSFFVNVLPKGAQKVIFVIRTLLIVLFGLLISYFSFSMIQKQMALTQLSPAMRIPMWIIYVPMFLGCILLTIRTVQSAIKKGFSDNQEVL
ncbi:MAG: TRAP transporter small permease [Lachnospiraceae bacterium]|nr:TRAP transporter small permease [Lachnospiraceae bacterium]